MASTRAIVGNINVPGYTSTSVDDAPVGGAHANSSGGGHNFLPITVVRPPSEARSLNGTSIIHSRQEPKKSARQTYDDSTRAVITGARGVQVPHDRSLMRDRAQDYSEQTEPFAVDHASFAAGPSPRLLLTSARNSGVSMSSVNAISTGSGSAPRVPGYVSSNKPVLRDGALRAFIDQGQARAPLAGAGAVDVRRTVPTATVSRSQGARSDIGVPFVGDRVDVRAASKGEGHQTQDAGHGGRRGRHGSRSVSPAAVDEVAF